MEAVGICKNCGKGLCAESAVDLVDELACAGVCETKVQALIKLIDRNRDAYPTTAKTYSRIGILMLIFGAVFVGAGLNLYFEVETIVGLLIALLGLIFIGGAGIYLSAGRSLSKRQDR